MKEFGHEKSHPFPTNDTDIVKCLKSGKWVAKIQHPISKVWVLLGSYTNAEEAAESCARKKLEYESNPLEISNLTDYEKQPGVRHTQSDKWAAKIKHKGEEVWLGTYNTQEQAAEAYSTSKLELNRGLVQPRRANNFNTPRFRKAVSKSGYHHVYKKKSGRWRTEIRNPITKARIHLGTFDTAEEAQQAYNKKKNEFDLLLASSHSKQNQTVEDSKSNSNCGSGEAFVPTDGSSMMNVNAGEFDLGVVDSYGRLIGEYSSLDDDLWIC